MLFCYSIYKTDTDKWSRILYLFPLSWKFAQQIAEKKVGADISENCNQKFKEEVSSKTLCQGMDIIQCRLLKTSRCVS